MYFVFEPRRYFLFLNLHSTMLRTIPGVLRSAEYKTVKLQDVKKLVYVLFFQFANWHLLIIFLPINGLYSFYLSFIALKSFYRRRY